MRRKVSQLLGLRRNPSDTGRHLRSNAERRSHVLQTIDNSGFNWLVVAIAGTGIFTSSYNLFTMNVILPALRYLYWPNYRSIDWILNELTLFGSVVGQLLFGYLADRYGRRRLLGVNLIYLIFSILGIVQSSEGYNKSMSVVGWLCFWRFLMGMGAGAGYPVCAVFTTEWAPRRSRSRMMAAVFLMQPLGQLVAAIVGLAVTAGLQHQYQVSPNKAVDQTWRAVTGVGAVPALIAVFLRWTIAESPRYTLDVANQPNRAVQEVDSYFSPEEVLTQSIAEMAEFRTIDEATDEVESFPVPFAKNDISHYFIVKGNWRYLAGTSICWYLLNFATCGLGTYNPRTLATLFKNLWSEDVQIYERLINNSWRIMLVVSTGSILGSSMLIMFVNSISRKKHLAWSFAFLAALFVATGIFFLTLFNGPARWVLIVAYGLCYMTINLGPNALIFMISAEIFPTRYRCTCYGISVAAGSVGSGVMQALLQNISPSLDEQNPHWLGGILLALSIILVFAAVIASLWLPAVQNMNLERPRNENKTLEELGKGIAGAQIDGQIIGYRKNMFRLWVRLRATVA